MKMQDPILFLIDNKLRCFPLIKLINLSKSYGSKILFEALDYHMPEGEKIALIGNNGSGKTTLLHILLGDEEADEGSVVKPPRLSLGSLKQEANRSPRSTIIEEAMDGATRLTQVKKRFEELTQKLSEP